MQQADQFVTPFAVGLLALLGIEFLILNRVVMFVEPHHRRTLIRRIVRHKQVTAIPDKNARRSKESVRLEDLLDRAVEPSLPIGGRHVADELPQKILIAGVVRV